MRFGRVIGITTTAYAVAFVFTLAFEVPFISLQKLFVGRESNLSKYFFVKIIDC
jgi:hypothetical protein